jgi:hypothetical protein
MARSYHIADEPSPNRWAQWVSSTHWLFLATMLGGSWIGLPWFVFNGYAVGSATWKKEIRAALLSPALALLFAVVSFGLIDALQIEPGPGSAALADVLGLPSRTYAYAAACIIAIKFWFMYRLQWMQSKSVDIHESYGGVLKNGAVVVGAAYLLRSIVLGAAAKVSIYLWVVVL